MLASERFVTLPSGLTLPIKAILLVLDLEARGFTLTRDDDVIVVRPGTRLTADDRAALTRWKPHVLALIDQTEGARQ